MVGQEIMPCAMVRVVLQFVGAMMRSGSGSAGAKCLALAGAWPARLAYTRRDGFAGEMARGPHGVL